MNMSFGLTQPQIENRTKTVTRRIGKSWMRLKPGQILRAVNKCMGFRKDEHPIQLAMIRIISVRREPLNAITQQEVMNEGFFFSAPEDFIAFFCKNMKCAPETEVTHIEFEYA
jgi:hypothetical protein